MIESAPELPAVLLRDVSRSFYLTLRMLPAAVRPQIGLAYLLARATDTIADTELLPSAQRLDALAQLRDRILGWRSEPVDFTELAENQALPGERMLLGRIETAIATLGTLPCFDRCCIREVVETITSGQELDLRRFDTDPDRPAALPTALTTDADLDDYTYRVAGCVGGFWTRLCRAHLYPHATLDLQGYLDDAVRFGKGLQLVNILRDIPADLSRGRCYIPVEALRPAGLQPGDLLDASAMPRFRSVYRAYLERAAAHLEAGWRYVCVTPRRQMRVRLACALPLLLGIETLRLLAAGNVLDGSRRIKVSRSRVRGLLARAVLLHPFGRCWEALFSAELPA